MIKLSTLCLLLLFLPAVVWAGKDAVGLEMHSDSPVIISADKYVLPNSMLHLWAVPEHQMNIIWRQNLFSNQLLPKLEIGAGPSFSMVNGQQKLGYYNLEMDSRLQVDKWIWTSYRLGQWSNYDELLDNGLLREQLFYSGFPLGLVGNNQFCEGKTPQLFWGPAYSFGRTGPFGTNKFFLCINLAKTDEMWAAWIIEI